MLLFSLSEIIILLKDHVYQPKSSDLSLYLIISLLAAASARFFLTRLLLAVTFIVQISEAVYYQFYGQFYTRAKCGWRSWKRKTLPAVSLIA